MFAFLVSVVGFSTELRLISLSLFRSKLLLLLKVSRFLSIAMASKSFSEMILNLLVFVSTDPEFFYTSANIAERDLLVL